MPRALMLSVRCSAAGSAQRPPGSIFLPMCSRPLRNVPAVITTDGARSSTPQTVRTPRIRGGSWLSACLLVWLFSCLVVWLSGSFVVWLCCCSSQIISSTWSCQMSRFGVWSSNVRHSQMNFPLSHCALGDHMAGPFDLFSIRNCIAVASVTSPMPPPRASISRTICPFAMPPTAGLHDICAILFMSIVTRQVLAPVMAAACAASQPACPPPTTMTSYLISIVIKLQCAVAKTASRLKLFCKSNIFLQNIHLLLCDFAFLY